MEARFKLMIFEPRVPHLTFDPVIIPIPKDFSI